MLGFETLTASFYSLSMLLTSTNFPDVALPAYKGNRASMLFFISFQVRRSSRYLVITPPSYCRASMLFFICFQARAHVT